MSRDPRERASAAFCEWARPFLIATGTARACVEHVETRTAEFGRVTWVGRQRRVVKRVSPLPVDDAGSDSDRVSSARDPWSISAKDLERLSGRIVGCPTCKRSGFVVCATCSGTSAATCSTCQGLGHARSVRTGAHSPCRSCKGAGNRPCGCDGGRVRCSACLGRGRVRERLVLVEEPVRRVLSAGDVQAAHALAGAAPLRVDWQGAPAAAPDEAAVWIARLPAPELEGVRWDTASVQVAGVPMARIRFRMARVPAAVDVIDGIVASTPAARAPLRTRRLGIGCFAAAACIWSAAAWWSYVTRHPYYGFSDHAVYLSLLVPGFGIAAACLGAAVLGPTTRRGTATLLASALSLLGLLAAQAGFAFGGHPTAAEAREALEAGELDRAEMVARACLDLGREIEGAREVLDALHQRRVAATNDLATAATLASEPFFDPSAAARARRMVADRIVQAIQQAQSDGNFSTTSAMASLMPGEFRADPVLSGLVAAAALHTATNCIGRLDAACYSAALTDDAVAGIAEEELASLKAKADAAARATVAPLWTKIRNHGTPLEERDVACKDVQRHLPFLLAATTPAFRPTPKELQERCARIAEEIDRKNQLESEARRREEQRQRERGRRDDADRRWASAPLRCNDGTLSPTCTCGGPRRGCCSHHGGVAGCSR